MNKRDLNTGLSQNSYPFHCTTLLPMLSIHHSFIRSFVHSLTMPSEISIQRVLHVWLEMDQLGAVSRSQVIRDPECEVEENESSLQLLGHSRSDMVSFTMYKTNSQCSGMTWQSGVGRSGDRCPVNGRLRNPGKRRE